VAQHRLTQLTDDYSPDRHRRPEPVRREETLGGTALGGPLGPPVVARLQRSLGNRATAALVLQRRPVLTVQRDDYPYGGADSVPHIHRYKGGSHLKILVGGKIKRINLVQDGVRYRENVAEAFKLARDAGDTALVDAIKECIDGIGPFGRPGSD
jgi:hypothetical protein